jgi:cytidylate kinase
MPIITISRGSYSRGKEVAEKVAAKMGFECVARDVLIEASKEFNVDEVKLVHAISDAPSLFDRISYGKQRYVTYIRAALLAHLKNDNVVYHGMAGHFFVRDIGHALKVRIIADMEDRIQVVMKRDGVSRKAARRFIDRIDKERKKWSQQMYGIDASDPHLYDLVIHVNKITVGDAVDIICHTAQLDHLQATDESRRAIEDEALAATVKAALVKDYPDAEVTSEDGVVFVNTKTSEAEEMKIAGKIEEIAKTVPGVNEVKVQLHPFTPFGT